MGGDNAAAPRPLVGLVTVATPIPGTPRLATTAAEATLNIDQHLHNERGLGLHTWHLSVRDALTGSLLAVAADDPLATNVFPLLADGGAHSHEELARDLDEDRAWSASRCNGLVDRWLAESPEPERYRYTGPKSRVRVRASRPYQASSTG